MRGEGIPGIGGTSGGDLLSGVRGDRAEPGRESLCGGRKEGSLDGGLGSASEWVYSPGCALVLKGARLKSGFVCGNTPVALSSTFSWTAVDGKSGDLLRVVASICS